MNSRQYLSIAALALCAAPAFSFAQDESDALRYSFLTPQGTARSMGFGSALGSVGGDFTTVSVNPAGIGVYRSSEVMFTPSLKFNNVSGKYLNDINDDNAVKFNFNNLGIVFTKAERGKRYERNAWKAISFGIGLNRLADFNRNYTYGGLMQGPDNSYNHSSFSEIFVNDANAFPNDINTNGTLAYLGYQSYLLNFDTATNSFYGLPQWSTGLQQLRSVEERGGITELAFSLGGNYQEKIMVGATLGLPTVRYSRDAFFEETDASGTSPNDFISFRYRENLETSGMGVNLKLGAIYKATDNFRLGAAIHTPTWFSLSDSYNEGLTTTLDNPREVIAINNNESRYDYVLTTPWRAIISATGMMGKYGFVTADYEFVDYGTMRFNFQNQDAEGERLRNQALKNNFQAASNFRLGIEGRMENLFFRGGVGYYGNPYKSSDNKMTRLDLSLGFGYRTENFFMDLGFVHSRYEQTEQPYALPAPVVVPKATLENRLNNMALTVGWKM